MSRQIHPLTVLRASFTSIIARVAVAALVSAVIAGCDQQYSTDAALGVGGYESFDNRYGAVDASGGYQEPVADTVGAEDPDIYENPFYATRQAPLSTFSIDVDAASYTNIRGYLDRGMAIDPGMVRIEELINYFSYDYEAPTNGDPLRFATEVATCPWNTDHQLVRIALKGKEIARTDLAPSNLVFLIDVSGSMASEDKLPLLKSSLSNLVDELDEEDRVAIVVYAGSAGVLLESTPGSDKSRIHGAIRSLDAGGSTAGASGIRKAYEIAEENLMEGANNRVILATDGDFNVGISSQSGLVKLIESRRDKGIFLSVLGFGVGPYRDGKMEQLADNGNGNYYYIDNIDEGERVLVAEMAGTLHTIAKDVKLQIEFNPDRVRAYRLIGYENRILSTEDFDDDTKDAGDLGAGHTVTAFYEVVPVGADPTLRTSGFETGDIDRIGDPAQFGASDIMQLNLRYKQSNEDVSRLITERVRARSTSIDAASTEFRFAAAVAEWGLLLRQSDYKADASFQQVLSVASSSLGNDPDGTRQEFLQLVRKTR